MRHVKSNHTQVEGCPESVVHADHRDVRYCQNCNIAHYNIHSHRHTSRGGEVKETAVPELGKTIFLGAITKFFGQKTAAENEKINICFFFLTKT